MTNSCQKKSHFNVTCYNFTSFRKGMRHASRVRSDLYVSKCCLSSNRMSCHMFAFDFDQVIKWTILDSNRFHFQVVVGGATARLNPLFRNRLAKEQEDHLAPSTLHSSSLSSR